MTACSHLTRITRLAMIVCAAVASQGIAGSAVNGQDTIRHSFFFEGAGDFPEYEFYLVYLGSDEQMVAERIVPGKPLTWDARHAPRVEARLQSISAIDSTDALKSPVVATSHFEFQRISTLHYRDPTTDIHTLYQIVHVGSGNVEMEQVSTNYFDFEGKRLPNGSFLRQHYHSMVAGNDAGGFDPARE